MGTLGRIPVETRSAPKRENWQLSPHRRGVGELCAWSWRVFWSGCGRPRRPLTKRLRFLHGEGPSPCSNPAGIRWACRYRPQQLQNTRARRPQKSRFYIGDRSHVNVSRRNEQRPKILCVHARQNFLRLRCAATQQIEIEDPCGQPANSDFTCEIGLKSSAGFL